MDLTNLEAEPVTAVDPNELLKQLRGLAAETMADLDDPEIAEDVSGGEAAMATKFLELDDWLARGGFLPLAWQDND